MVARSTVARFAPVLAVAGVAMGSVDYPTIPSDKTTPFQQRIAIKAPGAVAVGWNTYEQLSKPCVSYGTSSSNLSSQACSTTSVTYGTSRTWFNAVTLTGAVTSLTVSEDKIVSGNSSVDHFLNARTAGDTSPFKTDVVIDLGVYGENGYTTKKRDTIPTIQPALNHSTIGALARTVDDYEFVIHPGDFAYADDWYLTSSNLLDGKDAYEAILENFYDQLAPIAGRKLYMTSPGNHEADCTEIDNTSGLCPDGQRNFTDFMYRFGHTVPTAFPSSSKNSTAQANAKKAASLAVPPFWYSFEYGMAHIVMFDTETDFPDAPDGPNGSGGLDGGPFGAPNQQIDFLNADLASVDRTVTPWLIVAGHRPWYTTGGGICSPCQAAFESVFYKYGVDLVITGHVHNAQRFAPVYNNKTDPAGQNNPKAPMYIVVGGAGNIEGLDKVGSNYTGNVFAYADDFSYASLQFVDRTHLGIEFFRSSTGEVLDNSTLYKQHSQQFVVQ